MSKQNGRVEVHEFNKEKPTAGVKFVRKPIPEPGQGQVLCNVKLRPINPSDIFCMQGLYPPFPTQLPAVPGYDGVGTVVKAGAGADKFKPGQRVSALGWPASQGEGSFQEYVNVKVEKLVAIPDEIPDEVAAQFYINPVTVVGLYEEAAVPQGKYLLVTAAGSSLARMLIRYAKSQGTKVIGTVRRKEQVQEIKDLGAAEVICHTTEDLVERVKQITGGEGAYSACDAIGGDVSRQLGFAMRDEGHISVYGMMSDTDAKAYIPNLWRGVVYEGFWLEPYLMKKDPAGRRAVVDKIIELMRSGIMVPPVGETYPLDQIEKAVEHAQSIGRGGKIFLKNPA